MQAPRPAGLDARSRRSPRRSSTFDAIGDAHATHVEVGPAVARELGYVLVERQHLRTIPMGELGLGTQARAYADAVGRRVVDVDAPLGGNRATAGVELRADRFRDRDERGMQPSVTGDRVGGAVLARIDLESLATAARDHAGDRGSMSCAPRRRR